MADIQYLNYGDLQIELLALLNSLANNVLNYVAKQSWSNKRKEKFMSAYSDLMNRGILGASNNSGLWMIDIAGEDIPFDTMSKKDKEMYQEAAYFIQQQMSGLPTKSSQEKKDESELPKYDNFSKNFINYVSKNYYGGNPIRTQEDWNILDERNPETGLRGTDKRVKRLSEYLKNYSDSLEEGKYNFEGSSFKDLADLKNRINTAITKLNDGTLNLEDSDALNAIGLRSSDWFNNGSGDKFIADDGKEYTYGDYYGKILPAKLKKEQEEEIIKQKAARLRAYNNTLFINRVTNSKILGQNALALKLKYGNDLALRQALLNYAQSDIRTLTPDQLSEVLGIYRYLAKDPIDNKLLKQLLSSSSGLYKNAAPNRFKKINGIDNLIWDSIAGQVLQINTRQLQLNLLNYPTDLFAGIKTLLDIQDDYMNSTEGGFTPAELREVAALLFDLGAAVDPEGFSSAGLSQIAAGIRDYNRTSDPEGWTWGDTGWATLDHGLGLLSLIPVAGGYVKGTWAASKLANYLPKMEKAIRYLGRAGSTYAMAVNAPGALNTLNKIKNGEDLSLKDYLDLAYFFIGGLGHHQLNRGNRVERSAMKARGIETSNSVLNKAGITRTKAKTTNSSETTPTLKVLKTGEDGKVETKEIPITKEQEAALKKAKPGKLNEVATEAKINNIPEGYKIVEPTINSNWRSRINTAKSWFGKGNSKIFGTPTTTTRNSSVLKSDEEFEQYLSEHNNTWLKKFFNGSNRDIRRYDRYLGNNQVSKSSEETPKTEPNLEQSSTPKTVSKEDIKSLRGNEEFKQYRDLMDYKKKDSSRGILKDGTEHSIEFGGKSYNFKYDGKTHSIIINGKQIKVDPEKGMEGVRKEVSKFIQQLRKTTINSKKITKEELKEIVAKLKELKKFGFLKQGGTIDKQRIQRYKEFINK